MLSSATASIVDEEVFPADELMADDAVIGSGPYVLDQYSDGKQATLVANPDYEGDRAAKDQDDLRAVLQRPRPAAQRDQLASRSTSPGAR